MPPQIFFAKYIKKVLTNRRIGIIISNAVVKNRNQRCSLKMTPNICKKLRVLWPVNAENTIFWGQKKNLKNSSKKAEKVVDKGSEGGYNTNCSAPFGAGLNLENNIVQRKGQKEKLSFLQRDLYKNNLQKIGKETFLVQFLVKKQ